MNRSFKDNGFDAKILFAKRLTAICLLSASIAFLGGCSTSTDLYRSVHDDVARVINESLQMESALKDPLKAQTSDRLSFDQAFLLSARRDPEVRSVRISVEQAVLEIEQAKSNLWPRVDLEVGVEIPVTEVETMNTADLDGGVFLRYDFTKAFFFRDAAFAADVKQQRLVYQKMMTLNSLYFKLVDLFNEIELRQKLFRRFDAARVVVNRGLEFIDGLENQSQAKNALLQIWQQKDAELKQQAVENQFALNYQINTLKRMVGMPSAANIVISDDDQKSSNPQKVPSLSDFKASVWVPTAWKKRYEGRMAEIDLFLAEMEIVAAKRERLPHFTAAFGMGDIYLTTQDNSTSFVTRFGVSIPLLDMGDIRRKILRAEKQRDQSRESVRAVVDQIGHEIEKAVMEIRLYGGRLTAAEKKLNQSRQALETVRKLFALKRAEPMELFEAQLQVETDAMAHAHALFEYRSRQSRFSDIRGEGDTAIRRILSESMDISANGTKGETLAKDEK